MRHRHLNPVLYIVWGWEDSSRVREEGLTTREERKRAGEEELYTLPLIPSHQGRDKESVGEREISFSCLDKLGMI